MKREDVKNKIPGITEEQLNWLMQENGSDITREKNAAATLQTQLNSAQAQLKTAQDGLKAFDGVDVAGLQSQVTKLKADMQAQADGFAFDSALNTAILGKKGRSVDAVRALLDLDALKGSKDRTTDINKALEDAVKANPWAFGDTQPAGVCPNVRDGGTPTRHIPMHSRTMRFGGAAFSKHEPESENLTRAAARRKRGIFMPHIASQERWHPELVDVKLRNTLVTRDGRHLQQPLRGRPHFRQGQDPGARHRGGRQGVRQGQRRFCLTWAPPPI